MSNLSHTDTKRYERKFLLPTDQVQQVVYQLQTISAGLREIYTQRTVRSCYYDTPAFTHLQENLAGVSPRRKVRIRWYGDNLKHTTAQLEVKTKRGDLVEKDTQVLSIPLTRSDLRQPLQLTLEKSQLNLALQETEYFPVLENAYQRRYFLSFDETLRITLDFDLQFSLPASSSKISYPPYAILEYKYPPTAEPLVAFITQSFPYRLSKSSKYELGMQLTHPELLA